jgi:hypothetical protein
VLLWWVLLVRNVLQRVVVEENQTGLHFNLTGSCTPQTPLNTSPRSICVRMTELKVDEDRQPRVLHLLTKGFGRVEGVRAWSLLISITKLWDDVRCWYHEEMKKGAVL